MHDEIESIFEQAGCAGALLVQALDESRAEFGLRADEPAIPASVIKVLIALVAETCFAEHRLDPRESVALRPADRTPGPVGLSLLQDEVTLSLRDMVVLMLTISDNPSTDVLTRRVGLDRLNDTAVRLGLRDTVIESDLMTLLDSVGQDLGHDSWDGLVAWSARAAADESARADAVLPTVRAFDPARGTRSSPRDMVTLLRLIWDGQAGPPAACERVRSLMARQLTKNRIAGAFPPAVRIAAKSGSLLGIVRNEIGVITFPDGRRYAAAAFTTAQPGSNDAAINAAIGTATGRAVAALRDGH